MPRNLSLCFQIAFSCRAYKGPGLPRSKRGRAWPCRRHRRQAPARQPVRNKPGRAHAASLFDQAQGRNRIAEAMASPRATSKASRFSGVTLSPSPAPRPNRQGRFRRKSRGRSRSTAPETARAVTGNTSTSSLMRISLAGPGFHSKIAIANRPRRSART